MSRIPDIVEYAQISQHWQRIVRKDAFTYRRDRPCRWLQRLCLWVLRKLGCEWEETVSVMRRSVRENAKLAEKLYGQENIVAMLGLTGPFCIFVGPDEDMEIHKLARHIGMMPTTLQASFEVGVGDSRPEWHNIPIVVIPWMKGTLLVPMKDIVRQYPQQRCPSFEPAFDPKDPLREYRR